jgi:large subunit ribosomal protein L25
MKTVELKGARRSVTGKSAMKKIRRAGNVPAVIYGQGEPTPVEVGFQALHKVLHSADTYVVNLDIDGKITSAIVREAQFHPVNDNVLHVDFLRVTENEPVEVELPIQLVGTAKGVLAGGRLVPMLRKLKVRGIVTQLPDKVEIDISALELGKTIRVGEVQLEGLTITSPASSGIAIIEIPRAVKTAEGDAKK